MTMLLPGPEGLEHDDLCSDGERRFIDEECIALKTSCGQTLDKGVHESEVVPIMHRNGNLGLELLQHLTGRFWPHGIDPTDGDQCHIDASDLLDLLGGERMAQVSQVHDTEGLKLEQEGSPFDSAYHAILVDWDIGDGHLSHLGPDPIPFGAVGGQAAQDERIPLGKLYIVVIGMLSANGHRMRGEAWSRV